MSFSPYLRPAMVRFPFGKYLCFTPFCRDFKQFEFTHFFPPLDLVKFYPSLLFPPFETRFNPSSSTEKHKLTVGQLLTKLRCEMRSWESNKMENMCYMELREKTKYVLGLPGGTQIGLEHGKNYLRTMTIDLQPSDPPPLGWFDRSQRFNVFFLGFLHWNNK